MYMTKDISKWSDPKEAQKQAKKYLGDDVKLFISTRKDKKYMVQDPNGKWVHFGLFGAEDFTKHKNIQKRDFFRRRNAKWANADKWTPAFLSYYLLW